MISTSTKLPKDLIDDAKDCNSRKTRDWQALKTVGKGTQEERRTQGRVEQTDEEQFAKARGRLRTIIVQRTCYYRKTETTPRT